MRFLTTDETADWNAMLDDVNARPGLSTGERGDALVAMLHDAVQAHVGWAAMALDALAEAGAQSALKKRAKAISTTLVTFKDAAILRAGRVGVKSKRPSGQVFYEQKLFEEITWHELEERLVDLAKLAKGLGATIATDKKLLKLRKQYPASAGPGDACKQMGVTVEQYLGMAA